MIWSYLIHLGSNMWFDEGSVPGYIPHTDMPEYRDHLLCDMDVWREVTSKLPEMGVNTLVIDVGEGVTFESHPELAVRGSLSKDAFAKELDRLRALGLTPIPKLNFSACHDAYLGEYSHMLSTPAYYAVCRDLIAETAELFSYPKLFHIGMDEEDYGNQRSYSYAVIRNAELWWHDLYFLLDQCEKQCARPWVWSDYYWHNRDLFTAKMPKSVLQSNWCYDNIPKKDAAGRYLNTAVQAYSELAELGYEQVPTGSCWGYFANIEQTVSICASDKLPGVLGYMAAPWLFTTPGNKYGLLDNALRLGRAKNKFFPEDK